MKRRLVIGLLLLCVVSVVAVPVTRAFNISDVLKVGAVGVLIEKFATPLNDFVNTLTFQHGVGSNYATKVVPVLSLGNGGYIGAAQVIGTQYAVNKTQAVVQIEGDFSGSQFRVKALVPINSKNAVNFSRVSGVGVSAMIDVRI